jgi:hypothetical protein
MRGSSIGLGQTAQQPATVGNTHPSGGSAVVGLSVNSQM